MTPTLLLALLSWSSGAFAQDPAPSTSGATAPGESLSSVIEIAGLVARVHRESGAAVLIGAAGPDAERAALKVSEALPPGEVRVIRIGTIGDDATEMRGALDKAGLRCGIRLGVTTAMTYTATTYGMCSSLAGTASASADGTPPAAGTATVGAPTKVPTTSPTAPTAVSAIPGAGAALSAGAPASAPATTVPYLVAPPPPPDTAILQSTYDTVALRRVRNPNPRDDLPDATWAVRDGRGRTLSAIDFARRVGDLPTERRISREASTAKTVSLGLAVGGGVLAVAGLGLLLGRDAGAPDRSDFDVNIGDYTTNEEYFAAVAQAEADFVAAEDAHEITADDRAWIAGFLAGSGVIAIGVSPLASRGAVDRQGVAALYWTKEEADALIKAHNTTVREKIGLPEPEAPKAAVIEITPPPAPEDEEGEDSEDPPGDAAGDPKEDRREAPPSTNAPEDLDTPAAPAPRAPQKTPGLHITPVLSPTWTGLVGTF